jgi:hypothetical protein
MAASVRPSSRNSRTAELIFMELDTRIERQLHIKTRVAGRMRLRIRILSPHCSFALLNHRQFGK